METILEHVYSLFSRMALLPITNHTQDEDQLLASLTELDTRVNHISRKPLFTFGSIYTKTTLVVALISFLLGLLCLHYNFTLELATLNVLYFSFITLPLSILLGNAEWRRYKIFEIFAKLKSHLICLAYAYVDRVPATVEPNTFKQESRQSLLEFIKQLKIYVLTTCATADEYLPYITAVESALHNISKHNMQMRDFGLMPNLITRLTRHVSNISESFEMLRVYKYYRTSLILTRFLKTIIIAGCFIFVPYYITVHPIWGLLIGPFVAFTFLALITIKNQLENQFIDSNSVDMLDIDFDRRMATRVQTIYDEE